MKKLFFIGAFALIMLSACQSENNEVIASTSKTEEMAAKPSTTGRELSNEEKALNLVKFALVNPDVLSKPTPDPIAPSIVCHTDYNSPIGNACVSYAGGLYRVSWTNLKYVDGIPYPFVMPESEWTSVGVATCNCL
ncbi:hypothetical protein [Chryseobacterium rhizosphaerae]|uniref:hypothetical protein n=1 Tax=Chryseobacterium rhizosphaerae TaxID=395937 RepID=UPI003D098B3D